LKTNGVTLTPKQQRFVAEYLIDLNATQAAVRAGYSKRTAHVIGAENLTKPDIALAIREAQDERAERVKVSQDDVLRELLIILKSDVRDFHCDDDGNLTLREGAPDEAWRAVSSLKHRIIERGGKTPDDEQFTVREVEFKLWNKNDAIDKCMRHLGAYAAEKHEHSGSLKLEDLLAESRNGAAHG
jgi:phage terminase small subunit